MKKSLFLFLLFSVWCLIPAIGQENEQLNAENIEVKLPAIIVRNVSQEITLEITDRQLIKKLEGTEVQVSINGQLSSSEVLSGNIIYEYDFPEKEILTISTGEFSFSEPVNPIPLWLSILPPLIAIFLPL